MKQQKPLYKPLFGFAGIATAAIIVAYTCFAAKTETGTGTFKDGTIHIDCSDKISVVSHKAAGFMQVCVDSGRAKEFEPLLAPLRPQFFRMSAFYFSQQYRVLKHINPQARFQIVMSENWDNKLPLPVSGPETMALWRARIDTLFAFIARVDSSAPAAVEWDIWNEFDFAHDREANWENTFYALWDSTFAYLRAKGIPADRIAGPGFGGWRKELLDFLDHAKRAGTLPGIVSWHEIDDVSHTRVFENAVKKTREKLSSIGKSATKINIGEYSIGDYGKGYPHQNICRLYLNAAYALRMIRIIETSGVDLAARACHGYEGGRIPNHCWKSVLNGLVTDDLQKRSIWWVYQFYGALRGTIVKTSSAKLDVLAAIDTACIKVLLGKLQQTTSNDVVVIKNLPKEFAGKKMLSVTARVIKNSDWKPSAGPETLAEPRQIAVIKGTITIPVPEFEENGVVEIAVE